MLAPRFSKAGSFGAPPLQPKVYRGRAFLHFVAAMNKIEFIKQLGATADELKPFTISATSGSLTWDGDSYVEGPEKSADPHALAWWATLTTMAALLDAQESPLSVRQVAYIDRVLFGAMGSFNDFQLDSKTLGAVANTTNERLEIKRRALYASFE
jgi:hypothetical protein